MSPTLIGPSGARRLADRRVRLLVAVLAVLTPARVRRWLLVRLLGHDLAPSAVLGRSLVDVEHLVMHDDARIASGSIIRGCDLVVLERGARVGALNWVNAVRNGHPEYLEARHPALILRERAFVTTLHFIDACDEVEFGPWSRLAGFLSVVQTHAIDLDTDRQSTGPVRVGHHSMIATRCVLLPGSVVPPQSIVGAGAVVTKELEGHRLFAGVPAREVRPTDPSAPFFRRGEDLR